MENITITTDNSLSINAKPTVQINTGITILGYGSELPVKIIADFTDVPKEQHEIYLMAFQSNFSKNTDIQYNPYTSKSKKTLQLKPTIENLRIKWTINKIMDILFKK